MFRQEIYDYIDYIMKNDIYPPIVKVDYDPDDIMLNDPVRIAKRLRQYILAQTVKLDKTSHFCGIFRFDGSVEADVFHRTGHRHFGQVSGQYYNKPQENLATFEWQHSTANFAKVIDCGISQYIAEIDRALVKNADSPSINLTCASLKV